MFFKRINVFDMIILNMKFIKRQNNFFKDISIAVSFQIADLSYISFNNLLTNDRQIFFIYSMKTQGVILEIIIFNISLKFYQYNKDFDISF